MNICDEFVANMLDQITIVGHMMAMHVTAWITGHCARVQLVADVLAFLRMHRQL